MNPLECRRNSPVCGQAPVNVTAALPPLTLKHHEERRIRAGHPWVFSNEVDTARTALTKLAVGSIVRLQTQRDHFLGFAYVNPHALICARILSRDPGFDLEGPWVSHRLQSAIALRERLHKDPWYRMVFGESDGFPGLILDRYGDCVVGQTATAGMDVLQPRIEAAVRELPASPRCIGRTIPAHVRSNSFPRWRAPRTGTCPRS